MMDFIDNLANNDIFLTSLIIVLVILVITFFLVLFLGGKKNKPKNNIKENKTDDIFPTVEGNDVDFNHEEYVQEATNEFELTPVQDVKEVLSEVQLDKIEESPAYQVENNSFNEEPEMRNFSFDELSKMISDELDNIDKKEEETSENNETINNDEQDSFINTFKQVETEPISVEAEPELNSTTSFDSLMINKVVESEKNEDIVLPKLKDEETASNEPIIKDEEVPLYARFNHESFDLKDKD